MLFGKNFQSYEIMAGLVLIKRCIGYVFMVILILLSYLHITIFGVFITLQLNGRGCDYALTLETMLSYSSTRASKMAFIILMMLNTSMFFLQACQDTKLTCWFSELSQWLWSKLLQNELDTFMEFRNGCKMRKDKNKSGPSGMSRNDAFSLLEEWGRRDCLLKIELEDLAVISELKEELGGDALVSFSTPEFAALALMAYSLGIIHLTFENVWVVFRTMLQLVFV